LLEILFELKHEMFGLLRQIARALHTQDPGGFHRKNGHRLKAVLRREIRGVEFGFGFVWRGSGYLESQDSEKSRDAEVGAARPTTP
jgi:hypothetical protein